MKKLYLFLILVILVLPSIVSAENLSISFEDGSLSGSQSFDIYRVQDNSYMGRFNTTSTIAFDSNYSYVMRISPDRTDYVRNPQALLQDTGTFISGNLVALIAGAGVIGLIFWGAKK